MYKYRIFLQKESDGGVKYTANKMIEFFTPVHKDEEVILPSHVKELRDLPKWAAMQETWVVSAVIHQIMGSIEKGDFIILTPAPVNRLMVLISCNKGGNE